MESAWPHAQIIERRIAVVLLITKLERMRALNVAECHRPGTGVNGACQRGTGVVGLVHVQVDTNALMFTQWLNVVEATVVLAPDVLVVGPIEADGEPVIDGIVSTCEVHGIGADPCVRSKEIIGSVSAVEVLGCRHMAGLDHEPRRLLTGQPETGCSGR
ncbi:hypothetical protein D3C80_1648700 [compost metagenome]